MKSVISKIISIGAFIFVICVLGSKFDLIRESFLKNKAFFLLSGAAYLGGRWMDGARLRILLEHYGSKVKQWECFGLSVMYPLFNHFLPHAGLVTNAQYLKVKHGFRFTHFVSTGFIRVIVSILSYGIVGLFASIIYMAKNGTLILLTPLAFYSFLVGVSTAVFFIPIPKFLKKYSLFSKISEALVGMKGITIDQLLIFKLISFQLGVLLFFLIRYYFVFKALNLGTSFLNIAAILPMTALSNDMSVIPANFGIREAIVSASSLLIGYSVGEGVLVASVDRAVILISLALFGSWFFVRLKYYNLTKSHKYQEKGKNNEER